MFGQVPDARVFLPRKMERLPKTVEYHATMESCSDKFHVDIPNVVRARAGCTSSAHGALSNPHLVLIVAIVLLLLQRRTRIKNYQYRHRHYIVIHQQPLCVV
jgi:hypothetical protein